MKLKLDLAQVLERLKFTLALAGWPGIAGLVVLFAACAVEFVAVPQQWALAAGNQAAAERSHQDYLRAAAGDRNGDLGNAEMLARFRERLTSDKDADDVFEAIQRDALKNGLAPSGTEYKWERQPGAKLAEVRIVMPVKTGYAPLRAFIKDVLADVPGLALDQFDLQRENIGANLVEARLRFSLFLKVGT